MMSAWSTHHIFEMGLYFTVSKGELPTMEQVRLKHRWLEADTPNAHP
jgi:hypothetical protein